MFIGEYVQQLWNMPYSLNILHFASPYPSTSSLWSTSPNPQSNDQTVYSVPYATVMQVAFAASETPMLAPALPRFLRPATLTCLRLPRLRGAVAVKRAHR